MCCWLAAVLGQVSDVNGVVERLLLFLDSSYSHIVAETLVQLKDLLRRYPDLGAVRAGEAGWDLLCVILVTWGLQPVNLPNRRGLGGRCSRQGVRLLRMERAEEHARRDGGGGGGVFWLA
jgi:hypothetical protein